MAGAAPAIDYNQLAIAAIAQAAQAAAAAAGGGAAAGGAPAAPPAIGRYAGDGMDIERLESHVSKWLSTNCVDVNATVLQNVRLFMDHISNVYKEKVLLYETRDDMERILPDAPNPNAFSDRVSELCKEWNDTHPTWRNHGGFVRSGRFEFLPEKIAPCGLSARRHHGTKTGPDNGYVSAAGVPESSRGMFVYNAGVRTLSAFWQAHEQYPQQPEFCDFEFINENTEPRPYSVPELVEREDEGVYAGDSHHSNDTYYDTHIYK